MKFKWSGKKASASSDSMNQGKREEKLPWMSGEKDGMSQHLALAQNGKGAMRPAICFLTTIYDSTAK